MRNTTTTPLTHAFALTPPPPPPGASPRFTHLVGYGATYYSYLYAQCISASIWETHLTPSPTARAGGDALRERLLAPGGAREARELVGGLFAGTAAASGTLVGEGGGLYPTPGALLRQQGLLLPAGGGG